MKKILFLLLLFPLSLRANILISTACSEGGSTTWTIGEIMVATLSDNNSENSLTQGFLQPEHIVPSGIFDTLKKGLESGNKITPIFDIPEKATQITIFPNPAKEKVFVKIDEPFTWSIYDTLGKIQSTGKLSGTPGEYINVDNLTPGYYILTITSSKGSSSIQLIK